MATVVTHHCDVCKEPMKQAQATWIRITYPDDPFVKHRLEPDFNEQIQIDTCDSCTKKAKHICVIALRNAIAEAITNTIMSCDK